MNNTSTIGYRPLGEPNKTAKSRRRCRGRARARCASGPRTRARSAPASRAPQARPDRRPRDALGTAAPLPSRRNGVRRQHAPARSARARLGHDPRTRGRALAPMRRACGRFATTTPTASGTSRRSPRSSPSSPIAGSTSRSPASPIAISTASSPISSRRPIPTMRPSSIPGRPSRCPGDVYELGAHRLLCGDARTPRHSAGSSAAERPRACGPTRPTASTTSERRSASCDPKRRRRRGCAPRTRARGRLRRTRRVGAVLHLRARRSRWARSFGSRSKRPAAGCIRRSSG